MEKTSFSPDTKRYGKIILAIAGVYFAMKYISPLLAPFLLAFLAAGGLNSLIGKLRKKVHMKKSIWAGILFLIIGAGLLLLLWGLSAFLWSQGQKLTCFVSSSFDDYTVLLLDCCHRVELELGLEERVIEEFVSEQVDILVQNMEVNIFPAIMGKSVDVMKGVFSAAGFLAVTVISLLLILKDYNRILQAIESRWELKGALVIAQKVVDYVKTFVKAQLLILLVISGLCSLSLWGLGIPNGIFYGILTGIMDMLPFIGTGIMLVPLAFVQILYGSYGKAALILLLYGLCALTREILEPKLIGQKTGVWPVAILFAIFAGVKLFGLWGILKGPLSLVILCEIFRYLEQNEA